MADDFAPGANVGNPAGFISELIGAGESPTAGLQIFRDAGGAIRTESWFRLYGEVDTALQNAGPAASLNPYELPPANAYAPWTMNGPDSYATQVKVFFRDVDTGVIGSAEYTYRTPDPHTPAEAEAAAQAEYGDADNAADYGQSILGTATTNVYQTSAR